MTVDEALTVAGDVASISQALVVLDQRYKNLPGWEPLRKSAQLGWAALACALDASLGCPDLSVDNRGWRPRAKPIRGPARPGYLGVLQAEHNMLVRLSSRPTALNLRLIIDSQRVVSALLAERVEAIDRRAAERWHRRASTHQLLQRQLRDIGSVVGGGGAAAGQAAVAVSRLRAIPATAPVEPRTISGLATIFTHIDNRVAEMVESSLEDGQYFERTKLSIVSSDATRLVHMAERTYVPVTAETQSRLRAITRHRLRTETTDGVNLAVAKRDRAELQAALIHRPDRRSGPSVSL